MITRMILLMVVAVLISAFGGCASSPKHRPLAGHGVAHLIVAQELAQPSVVLEFEPNVTYAFTTPVRLSVRYRTRPPGGALRKACFDAYAIPLAEGGTYTLTLKTTEGEDEQGALLVIKSGAILVRGSSPAVGGSETGTWGEGTRFIIESVPNDRDYVYLLDHGQHNHDLLVFRINHPNRVHVDTIPKKDIGHVRGYGWIDPAVDDIPSNRIFRERIPYVEDGRRKAIVDRLSDELP